MSKPIADLIVSRTENMETVHHYLNELDIRQLLDCYFCNYPIDFEPPALKDLTVSQIRRRYRDAIRRFVVRLRGLDVKDVEDGKISILFAYRCMEDWSYRRSIDFGLVHADEILKEGSEASVYCFEMMGHAEIVGFLVSDDEFTRKHICELIANVLYQASFFGIDEGRRKKAIDDFERSIEKAEKEEGIPLELVMKEFETKFGIEFDKESPDEEKLRSAAQTAVYAYGEHCRKKQMSLVADALRNDPQFQRWEKGGK